MILDYLGDAPDHWKGSLHRVLLAAHALRDLHALPMATDAGRWQAAHYDVYAKLLGMPLRQVFQEGMALGVAKYFREADKWLQNKGAAAADLFLDPNKGLRVACGIRATHYVHVDQLEILSPPDCDRVLMIYDETQDRKHAKADHITKIGDDLRCAGFHWAGYEAGRQLTMFFVTRQSQRQNQIYTALAALLGPCAQGQHKPRVRQRLFP
ncbi:MAG: hypothetical protein JJU36_03880 [Phycisphaeraceae bacterium]|nr:hypothetical protein [Phycisphaeraceae bacterium]